MPFTPFHMGAALLVKPMARRRFSVLVFGVSQVLIDVEPLVRILRGDRVLHGWTHTIGGALVIGAVAALVSRAPVNWWLRQLRRSPGDAGAAWLSPDVGWRAAFLSSWIGTGSHLVFDAVMHADMHPLAPFTLTNPLLGIVPLDVLHLGLVAAGVVGLVLLAADARRR